jgi:hypothetical protein
MVEQLESALEAKIRQYKSWRDAPFCGVCKAGTLGLKRWFLDISGSLALCVSCARAVLRARRSAALRCDMKKKKNRIYSRTL